MIEVFNRMSGIDKIDAGNFPTFQRKDKIRGHYFWVIGRKFRGYLRRLLLPREWKVPGILCLTVYRNQSH